MKLSDLTDGTRIAAANLADYASDFVAPSVRLGVTGLSRSGKTVFISALVYNLINNARLPLFLAATGHRITRAYLEPQPDDDLPRFAYERHMKALTGKDRHWPEGTKRLSQLRVTIEYRPTGFLARNFSSGKLHVDIIDYPGEWLLDLPLLTSSFEQWSRATLAAAKRSPRDGLSADWRAFNDTLDPASPEDEDSARKSAALFTDYLKAGRDDAYALSTLPPGRFLMPGDLADSPLLTFAPLNVGENSDAPAGSLHAMMKRRYDAYVDHIVRPFYVKHFARLDRQIVLVDVMSALNAGPSAVEDLRTALSDILTSFRQGRNSILSSMFAKRIDKVLFAATKADMLHHTSHDRLKSILALIIEEAASRAEIAGAGFDVTALAAMRATKEASVTDNGETLECITGIPEVGQKIAGDTFDGETQAAIFPGDLPEDPAAALDGSLTGALSFVRFRPPLLAPAVPLGPKPALPNIRLDHALQYLLGDCFK